MVGYEPVFHDGKVVGFCTSGGYSHFAGKSVAMALIPRDLAADRLLVEIEIMGQRRKATRVTTPPFDPEGQAMRG